MAIPLLASVFGAEEPPPLQALETEMARLVNAERAREKLPALTWDDALARVARAHGADMLANRFFAHDSPTTGKVGDRLERAGIPHRGCAENLAGAATLQIAHANLMASPGHRKNILSPDYTHLGIGILRDPGGSLVCVQVFTKAVPVLDTAALPEKLLADINAARAAQGLRRLVPHDGLMKLALEHCQRAEKTGKADPLWLEDRVVRLGGRWTLRDASFFLTEKPSEVVTCPAAMSRRYEDVGIGIIQTSPYSKTAGALWITLICGQR